VALCSGPFCASIDSEVVVSAGASPFATSTHSALRSVPTATVRTHLPGLFSSEPFKGSHYTTTFMPLIVLGHLLATMKGTKELSPLAVTAVGVQAKPL
jgi:hypothetical protein